MRLVVSSGGVPAGSYLAAFRGVEPVTNDYGDGLKWTFEVTGGSYAGSKTGCTTSVRPSQKNSCGRIVAGISGMSLSIGSEIDLAAYIGRVYLIVVIDGKNGGTYISAVTQPPGSPAPQPAITPAPLPPPQPCPSPTPST